MANTFTQVPADSTGDKIAAQDLVRGVDTVLRQEMVVGDPTADTLVNVGGGVEANALRVTVANDSTGVLSVDDNAGTLTIDNTTLSTTGGGVELSSLRVTIANDSTGLVSVDDNAGSLTVDATNLDIRDLAHATDSVRIGDGTDLALVTAAGALVVDGSAVTQPVSGTVTANQGTANATGWEVVGEAAQDAAAAGNPVLCGASSETMADSAPTNRVSADGDVGRVSMTDGAVFVIPTGPQTWSYHEDSSSALTDTVVHAAPAAGLSLYVTDIVFSTGAATVWNIFFEAPNLTTVLGPWYLEAVAGRGAALHFGTPKKITAATALTVTTSAAIAHSIDVTGFIAQG